MTADRRQQPDRRHQLRETDGNGRRASDHGTRTRYQLHGCRCTPCRAANAAYEQDYRTRKATGKPLMGTRISAARTHILMKVIRSEAVTAGELDQTLGLHGHYARVRQASRITLRTALKFAWLYRVRVAESLES